MGATVTWYKNHTGHVISRLDDRPDGREQWYAQCRCGWYGTFITRRAAEIQLRLHKGPW